MLKNIGLGGNSGKEPANAGDISNVGLIPGSEKS